MQVQQKPDEPDGNVLSRGEGASSPALVRRKRPGASDYELLLITHLLSDLWASWIVNTPSSTLATMALTTSVPACTITLRTPGARWLRRFWELSLYAYKWLLNHFDKKKAHRIHRNIICHSLFWLAFAKAYQDRSKPGRHKYNPEKMARNLAEGRTAMTRVKDPIEYEGKVFATLGQLFDDVRHQKLAVGIPCRPDYRKQEDEILTHLAKLTRDKRNDTV